MAVEYTGFGVHLKVKNIVAPHSDEEYAELTKVFGNIEVVEPGK